MPSPLPLILIHGYPFDHTLWTPVTQLLPPNLKVLAPDLPGFGGKPVSPSAPDLNVLADAVVAEMKKAGIPQGLIVGMSMGGYVALALAEKYPECVAGLVMIDTQSAADSEEAKKNRRALIDKIARDGIQPAVEAALPKMFGARNAGNPSFKRIVTSGAERAGVAGISWALEAMARRPDRTALLQTCRYPVLFIHGTEDQFVPVEKARQLAQSISQSGWVEIPGAGHVTPAEAPAEVARALADFAQAIERARESGATA